MGYTLSTYNMKNIDDTMLKYMFDMYKISYSLLGIWFENPDDLKTNYDCGIFAHDKANPDNKKKILAYILYKRRKTVNKISLACHDGTENGKKTLIKLLIKLLSKPGYVIEASFAVSWILRKNKVNHITDLNVIKKLLDVNETWDDISINNEFDYNDKNSQHYRHKYIVNNNIKYGDPKTLFGTSGCVFKKSKTCKRKCTKSILTGAGYISRYKKMYHINKSKYLKIISELSINIY